MGRIKTTLKGSLGYRGGQNHWSYLLHRITGLGTLSFLVIHILDTSTVYFFPSLYEHAINIYRLPLFIIGEIFLVWAVLFHGINGLRITILDFYPALWNGFLRRRSILVTVGISLLLWLPAAIIMGRKLLSILI